MENSDFKSEIIEELEKDKSDMNLKKNRILFKRYVVFFTVILLLASSFFFGYEKGKKDQGISEKEIPINESIIENKFPPEEKNIDFSLFWKVWDLLKEKHIDRDKIDTQKLIYGSINGMLRATGDPYTDFFNPEESRAFTQDIEGSFEGIGAELGIKDDILTIIAPLDDSPAEKAGLRAGDKILKVDDRIVADLTIDEAVDLIRGEKGTQVVLTILREGENDSREITVIRDNIEIKNVKIEFRDDGIAYVRIIKFSDNVDSEFRSAANAILNRESKGIILDVRNNPGGLLDEAVEIASYMIPRGKVVVAEEDSTGKKENLYTSGEDKLSQIPTVVLINEGSASASEILAGALRDNQSIALIGKKTFGKGSVQQLLDLPEGSSVKITVAKWLTPSGNYIMDTGINPDIEVDLTLDDYNNGRDPQMEKALEVIKEKINL